MVASGSVVTSLGIPLSHMRESKVVHALLGRCQLGLLIRLGMGSDGRI